MQLARGLKHARDLAPGEKISVEGNQATVVSLRYCNGTNGEPAQMFGAIDKFTKTAAALKIEFQDREPIYVHPGQKFAASY